MWWICETWLKSEKVTYLTAIQRTEWVYIIVRTMPELFTTRDLQKSMQAEVVTNAPNLQSAVAYHKSEFHLPKVLLGQNGVMMRTISLISAMNKIWIQCMQPLNAHICARSDADRVWMELPAITIRWSEYSELLKIMKMHDQQLHHIIIYNNPDSSLRIILYFSLTLHSSWPKESLVQSNDCAWGYTENQSIVRE